jgi:transcriptional regulator of heat shock response
MADLSIVTCSYDVGRGHRGAIGVIGPTRMPYRQVLDTLSVAGRTLSQILMTPNDE